MNLKYLITGAAIGAIGGGITYTAYESLKSQESSLQLAIELPLALATAIGAGTFIGRGIREAPQRNIAPRNSSIYTIDDKLKIKDGNRKLYFKRKQKYKGP